MRFYLLDYLPFYKKGCGSINIFHICDILINMWERFLEEYNNEEYLKKIWNKAAICLYIDMIIQIEVNFYKA